MSLSADFIPIDYVTVADPGGPRGPCPPPGPVKIGHKKDGHQRRPHRFHVSRPPPLPGRWIRYCVKLYCNVHLIESITVFYAYLDTNIGFGSFLLRCMLIYCFKDVQGFIRTVCTRRIR